MTKRTMLTIAAAALMSAAGVLGFQGMLDAAPPFNPVEQRLETINELKEIKAQLKELNAMFRNGTAKVVVSQQAGR